jgi:hypothetical protein
VFGYELSASVRTASVGERTSRLKGPLADARGTDRSLDPQIQD